VRGIFWINIYSMVVKILRIIQKIRGKSEFKSKVWRFRLADAETMSRETFY
jgi:hypothetical protein